MITMNRDIQFRRLAIPRVVQKWPQGALMVMLKFGI